MEKYFGNAYRGDPGVPHAGPDRWHDKAMIFEHYHWKKAKAKNQPYKFKWNEYMDKDHRDSYYFNWPVYFP
ncbi:Glutathione gamma-glutamylcysteinyltransferase 1 [Gossypium arboreum]|uniref:Glutathione gamma-glutamylcysteinyltransferase 1 n=1 Tax=Gossypium arboreum TaxID=29729 RepID=A0A0B0MWJ0_GOSAR|nr:Glutathione gamma-glutamylcysteinyltransferase 1 [Gossypium arboreum]KHG13349.1 Glutathione gamma-glutamylcysteinyltransferase 1 [Gossypium arboreum]